MKMGGSLGQADSPTVPSRAGPRWASLQGRVGGQPAGGVDGKPLLPAASSSSWRKVPEPELNTLSSLPKSVTGHSNSPGVAKRQREAKGFTH